MSKNKIFPKLLRYYYTVKDLKFRQIFYRVYYVLTNKRRIKIRLSLVEAYPFVIQDSIGSFISYTRENSFSFMNLSHQFHDKIDWNFKDYGMLWAYNLNYFEFLLQENLSREDGLRLIKDYIDQSNIIEVGFDPYPVSLRNIFWIRFVTKHSLKDDRIDSFIYENYKILLKKIEYHLLGNHLLENAYSLLFGAYYFRNPKFYKKAKKILTKELNEQILSDGAHFELSPMYHQIMLYRLLDCVNLVSNNNWLEDELLDFLYGKASQMLSWINAVTLSNGDIPLVNDATFHVTPTTEQLNSYAERLAIKTNTQISLGESGYRKFKSDKFELFVDIGTIGPDYQPGHSHADTLSFILCSNNRPVIIDSGTSTYEVNSTRFYERSTAAHNTVEMSQKNSSDVWSGHRTGRKAKVNILKDTDIIVQASHNGYRCFGENHTRTFEFSEQVIKIIDEITDDGVAYFHFNPDEPIINLTNNRFQSIDIEMEFVGATRTEWITTHCSLEFNKTMQNKCLIVFFSKYLETIIL